MSVCGCGCVLDGINFNLELNEQEMCKCFYMFMYVQLCSRDQCLCLTRHERKVALVFSPLLCHISSEMLLEQEPMWAGLNCVYGELIGWLWFAVG